MALICQSKYVTFVCGLFFLTVSIIGVIYTISILIQWLSRGKGLENDSKREFKKEYATPEEEAQRRGIFLNNKRHIDEHNKLYDDGLKSYELSLNHFADQTLDEIVSKRRLLKKERIDLGARTLNKDQPIQFESSGKTLPESVDWRKSGIVSPIKSQGDCLACYAVVAAEAIEAQYARIHGQQILFSAQQIVDCSSPEGNFGCHGGMVDWSYQYVMRAGGLMSESDYPYTAEDNVCAFNKSNVAVSITNYVEIKNGSEIALQEAVADYGPVSVSIDTGSFDWYYFTGTGIFDHPDCFAEVNHGVLVVGYGSDNGTDYWIVKNSYGYSFGDEGYIKMSRNKNNQCSIASYANFPVIGQWKRVSTSANGKISE
ncbi:unnamed protein product [Nesidiocoris tenuis]|uniref:Peptidase C1A papain C-terminal domain-containing protein n=1 Tax=Nesidiocoris tenuis TaxID=355587 RepID=A0A6H5I0B9_9HEMI|nr:unnamed protein product [Nesidiocoris tenuis]